MTITTFRVFKSQDKELILTDSLLVSAIFASHRPMTSLELLVFSHDKSQKQWKEINRL